MLQICLYFLARGFSNINWWALATRCIYFLRKSVFHFSLLPTGEFFVMVELPAKAGYFTREATHVKRPHTIFTRVTCIVLVKTVKFTCFYAASTSRRIHATAPSEARKLRLTSTAGCRLVYLQFAGEFTLGVMADCQQLRVFLFTNAGIFVCNCGFFSCDCRCFCLLLRVFLFAFAACFACKMHVFLAAKASNFACQSREYVHEFHM